MTNYTEVRTTEHESGREQRIATFKATQLIWLLLGFLEAVLALRFFFKLIGVNAANPFAALLYNMTDFFVAPFASLTGVPAVGGMVFEFSTLIAMLVYALIGWALERLFYVLFYRQRGPVSVRQTTIADHTSQQAPVDVRQTAVTPEERTNTTQKPPVSL